MLRCVSYVLLIVGLQVELLLRVHHINLVSLIGYCDERDHLALIYEYMSNVDLRHHLSGKTYISKYYHINKFLSSNKIIHTNTDFDYQI